MDFGEALVNTATSAVAEIISGTINLVLRKLGAVLN